MSENFQPAATSADRDEVICKVLRDVARGKSPDIDVIQSDHALVEDLGLRSLDLAQIVVKLEMELGVDPFASLVPVTSVRTVADLCGAYAKCFSQNGNAEQDADDREQAQQSRDRGNLRLKIFESQRRKRVGSEARKGL